MPRFSVVIPTRNRADLLAKAVASAAGEAGDAAEIIVSDNSTDPAAVAATSELLATRFPEVRHVRPDNPLPMPQHWEFATAHASGDYLLILTDRFVMRPGALATIGAAIDHCGPSAPDILTWNTEAGFDSAGHFHQRAGSGAVRQRRPADVLAEFASCAQWRSPLLGSNSLPRGLNSAVRRDLVEEARADHGTIYAPLSPDYTSAFHQLARARGVIEIDLPLYAAHGDHSNGATTMRDGTATYTAQFEVDPFEGCPLKIDTVMNTTVRDYLWVGKVTGAAFPEIDLVGYLLINLRELQLKRELGSKLDIAAMERAILAAAKALPPKQREAFAAGKREIDARETAAFRLRNRLAGAGLLGPLKAIAQRAGVGGKTGPRYGDVLEAVAANPLPPLSG
jgi:hypothetical protein